MTENLFCQQILEVAFICVKIAGSLRSSGLISPGIAAATRKHLLEKVRLGSIHKKCTLSELLPKKLSIIK